MKETETSVWARSGGCAGLEDDGEGGSSSYRVDKIQGWGRDSDGSLERCRSWSQTFERSKRSSLASEKHHEKVERK